MSRRTQRQTTVVRLHTSCVDELRLLKIAWRLSTFDAVLERLLAPHTLEKIRALNIATNVTVADPVIVTLHPENMLNHIEPATP